MPFKDTPGLRRVAAMAIENRDLVEVRVLELPLAVWWHWTALPSTSEASSPRGAYSGVPFGQKPPHENFTTAMRSRTSCKTV